MVSCVLLAQQFQLVPQSHISFYNYFIRRRTQLNQFRFLCCRALMLALIVTNLSWLSICCASQASAVSLLAHLHLCQKLCSHLGSCIFLTIFASLYPDVYTKVHNPMFAWYFWANTGWDYKLVPPLLALGTEISQARAACPSHPGDRAGLVQGHGKESGWQLLWGDEDSLCYLIQGARWFLLLPAGVGIKGGQEGGAVLYLHPLPQCR